MYTVVKQPTVCDGDRVRWLARTSAGILFTIWLAMVLAEVLSLRFQAPPNAIYQAVALAVVFAGYAIGWRQELTGGMMAILGTIAYFLINVLTIGPPPDGAALFAVPGIFYVWSWYVKNASGSLPRSSHEAPKDPRSN
jgi:hypothetical protein